MVEEWRVIDGYDGAYYISSLGRIKSMARTIEIGGGVYRNIPESILKFRVSKRGYAHTALRKNNKAVNEKVHRLVAMAFIPNPENKPMVNHKDGNKTNNDVSNLEWCTARENSKHAYDMGLSKLPFPRGRGCLYNRSKEQHLEWLKTVLRGENHYRSRKTAQYDNNHSLIIIHESVDAAAIYNNVSNMSILRAMKSDLYRCKGFIFKEIKE